MQAKPSLDEAIRFENEMECLSRSRKCWLSWTSLSKRRNREGRKARAELRPTQALPAKLCRQPRSRQRRKFPSASVSEDAGRQMNATSEMPSAPQAAADPEGRIVQPKSEKEAPPGEVSRIGHDQEAPRPRRDQVHLVAAAP